MGEDSAELWANATLRRLSNRTNEEGGMILPHNSQGTSVTEKSHDEL
jgi:hypothetical protein